MLPIRIDAAVRPDQPHDLPDPSKALDSHHYENDYYYRSQDSGFMTRFRPCRARFAPAALLAVALANDVAREHGWREDAGGVFVMPSAHLASLFFFRSSAESGAGLGRLVVTIDTKTGRVTRVEMPGIGRAGDLVMQVQFPWHSGRLPALRVAVSWPAPAWPPPDLPSRG